MLDIEKRVKITKIFLLTVSALLFFWWPLSHWFYSDWYHTILGFETWNESLVKMIGTCGIFPVIIMFVTGLDPVKNRSNIYPIIIFFLLLGFTFLYLVQSGEFPVKEYINAVLCIVSSLILLVIKPNNQKE